MEFNLSTPALLFSAISLLILAYTNRFLAVAALVRQHINLYEESNEENILKQINNFETRLKIIKYTQVFGVVSFLFCVVSMVLIFTNRIFPAKIVFLLSLITLFVSLLLSLQEVFLSIGALNIELERIRRKKK
jgi:predicted membrane protein